MRRGIALIALAVAALGGCGQAEHRTIPVRDLVAAVDQTRSAPSQRVHIDTTMSAPGLAGDVHMDGDGVIDNRTGKGRMTLDMSELADVPGSGIGPDGDKAEQIIDGLTFYMRWPPLAKQAGGDKPWAKFDLQKLGQQQGFDFSALGGTQGDPTKQLDELRATSGDVEVIGDETVRGVPTTHYRATIDLRRYPDTAKPADRERVRKSVERLIELTGEEKIPTEVWIGQRTKRIQKTRTVSQYKLPQGGGKVKQDISMELYDFGAPVGDVSPPPPEDVFDIADAPGAKP